MKNTIALVLIGFGCIGRAFAKLLEEKKGDCRLRYGLDLSLKGILEIGGGIIFSTPRELSLAIKDSGSRFGAGLAWNPGLGLQDLFKIMDPGVLVDCTVSNLKTGEPGASFLNMALDSGWHAATASKGALASDFTHLMNKARTKGLSLKYSAATGAALPALDIGLYSLAGADIMGIEGILNGTTNYILTRMGEGLTFDLALEEARQKGIAEPDPSMDIEGWDTACKLLLISNAVARTDLSLGDVKIRGISKISPPLLNAAKDQGKVLKLLGKLKKRDGRFRAEVGVFPLDEDHPLFGVSGTNKGITFDTDTMGAVTVSGGKSDPRGAAAALLKDIINIYR